MSLCGYTKKNPVCLFSPPSLCLCLSWRPAVWMCHCSTNATDFFSCTQTADLLFEFCFKGFSLSKAYGAEQRTCQPPLRPRQYLLLVGLGSCMERTCYILLMKVAGQKDTISRRPMPVLTPQNNGRTRSNVYSPTGELSFLKL